MDGLREALQQIAVGDVTFDEAQELSRVDVGVQLVRCGQCRAFVLIVLLMATIVSRERAPWR